MNNPYEDKLAEIEVPEEESELYPDYEGLASVEAEFALVNVDSEQVSDDPQPAKKERMNPVEFIRKHRGWFIAGAVCAVAAAICLYLLLFPVIGDGRHFIFGRELDLSNQNISSTQNIDRMVLLRKLDLRGNTIPEEEVMTLAGEMPGCEIYFDVFLAGKPYDAQSKQVILTGVSEEEFDKLHYFAGLEVIDARGHEIDVVEDLMAEYPESQVLWDIEIGDDRHDYNAEDIVITAATKEDIVRLAYLPDLKHVNLCGTSEYEALFAFMRAYPDVQVTWDVEICGQRYACDTTELTIPSAGEEDIKRLVYLPELKSVDASGCTAYEALMETSEAMPDCDFLWTVRIGKMDILSTAEKINFKRAKVDNVSALSKDFENLKYLPALKEIDMCGCKVKNKQMAAWRDKYPEYKFVWEISFGVSPNRWTVRTDIKVFSTLLSERYEGGTSKVFNDLFLYCTDLVALDLGHNRLTDISAIANLKNLQAVILTDNHITDISPLGKLENLVMAELNGTWIKDLTPLQNCKKLRHLDVYSTEVRDKNLPALYDCDNLDYLVLRSNNISKKAEAALRKKLPDCTLIMVFNLEGRRARNNAIRSEFKLAFKNYKNIVDITDYQNVTYKKGVKLIVPYGYRGNTPKEHAAQNKG